MEQKIILQAQERSNHWPESYESITRPISVSIDFISEYELLKITLSSPDKSLEVNGFKSEQQHYSLNAIDLLEREAQNALNLIYYNKETDTTITVESSKLMKAIRDLQKEKNPTWIAQATNTSNGITAHEMMFDLNKSIKPDASIEEVIDSFKKIEKIGKYASPFSEKKDTKIEHVILTPEAYQTPQKTPFIKHHMENYAFNFSQAQNKFVREKEEELKEIENKGSSKGLYNYEGIIQNLKEDDDTLNGTLLTPKGNLINISISGDPKKEMENYKSGQTLKIGILQQEHNKEKPKVCFLKIENKTKIRENNFER